MNLIHVSGNLRNTLTDISARLNDDTVYSDSYLLATVSYDPESFSHYPDYSGDVPGRWVHALVMLEKCGIPQPRLHSIVPRILKYQRLDGGFHRPEQSIETVDRAAMYGNGWLLQGLCDYAEHTGSQELLKSLRRFGEYYLEKAKYWFNKVEKNRYVTYGHGYNCFSHGLAGVVSLYRLTRDQRFLDLAEDMAEWSDGFEHSAHSHMHLSTLRGILDLYEVTENKSLLKYVLSELKQAEGFSLPGGGMLEVYGVCHGDEECSTADFMLCCLKLWKLTQDECWRRKVEHIYFNYQQYARMDCGLWGSMPVSREILRKSSLPAFWCCSMFGAYAQTVIPCESVTCCGDSARINWIFPVKCRELEIETRFPLDGHVKITLLKEYPPGTSLHLALPANTSSRLKEFPSAPGGRIEFDLEKHLVFECGRKIEMPEYTVLEDASLYYGPELLVWTSPMIKRRGHFVILKYVGEELEFFDPLEGKTIKLIDNFPYATRVKFMRIKGCPFMENIISRKDIYDVTVSPMARAGNYECEAIIDAVIVK